MGTNNNSKPLCPVCGQQVTSWHWYSKKINDDWLHLSCAKFVLGKELSEAGKRNIEFRYTVSKQKYGFFNPRLEVFLHVKKEKVQGMCPVCLQPVFKATHSKKKIDNNWYHSGCAAFSKKEKLSNSQLRGLIDRARTSKRQGLVLSDEVEFLIQFHR